MGESVARNIKKQKSMDYNATKGGGDNLDKLVTGYSCKIRTLHWPLLQHTFCNILDISAYNAFVIWMALNPDWNRGKLKKLKMLWVHQTREHWGE